MAEINYKEEVKRLEAYNPEENSEFWKPAAGQYKVRALTELEETDPYEEEGKEPKPQAKIDMMVEDKKVTWTVGKGKSLASAYGQLCQLAKADKLKDVDFTIVVTFDGKKNSYTIVV